MAAILLDVGGLLCNEEEPDSDLYPESPSGTSESLSDASTSAPFHVSACQCSWNCPLPPHHGLWPRTSYEPQADLEDCRECIEVLIQQELHHLPSPDYFHRVQDLAVCPERRGDAIRWIMQVRSCFNYSLLTASLAVNYMDRFLSAYPLPDAEWPLQLVAVACLAIAAKMEEVDTPFLSDIQSKTPFCIKPELSQRMEILVLSTLKWRVHGVTSFSFVDPYLAIIGADGPFAAALNARVSELLLRALLDVRFLAIRPSITAAAAVMQALHELPRRDAQVYQSALMKTLSPSPAVLESCRLLLAEVANSTIYAATSEDSGLTCVAQQVVDPFPRKPAPSNVGWAQAARDPSQAVASRALSGDGVSLSGKRKRQSLRQ
ncbi:CYCLIN D [Klebsormidium nitens]|uniref:CYCLIN D n=1 Tax=Klebsormidium nitens TaxID=105231 RepID=A0A1Y1HUC6_KLENI|nr:CYCLIN D [Klebsormidium nitens]|eukprot:GAQ81442.1 CYCLIN D [Klebsormidium nitens]